MAEEKLESLRDRIRDFKKLRGEGDFDHWCGDLCAEVIRAFEGLALNHLLLRIEGGEVQFDGVDSGSPKEDVEKIPHTCTWTRYFTWEKEDDPGTYLILVSNGEPNIPELQISRSRELSEAQALFMVNAEQFAMIDWVPTPFHQVAGYDPATAEWHPIHGHVEDGDTPPPVESSSLEGANP